LFHPFNRDNFIAFLRNRSEIKEDTIEALVGILESSVNDKILEILPCVILEDLPEQSVKRFDNTKARYFNYIIPLLLGTQPFQEYVRRKNKRSVIFYDSVAQFYVEKRKACANT